MNHPRRGIRSIVEPGDSPDKLPQVVFTDAGLQQESQRRNMFQKEGCSDATSDG